MMNFPEEKIRGAMLGIITGDALGTPLEGISRAHIAAIFKSMESYADPEPALQGRMERWRKPGLYSSISQTMILLCLSLGTRRKDPWSFFMRSIAEITPAEGGEYEIFRHPGLLERNLLGASRTMNKPGPGMPFSSPCARMIPIVSPIALVLNRPVELLSDIIPPALLFNSDPLSVSALLIFSSLLARLASMTPDPGKVNLVSLAIGETENLISEIRDKSDVVFGLSLNPDALSNSADSFLHMLSRVEKPAGRREAEAAICDEINRVSKGHIIRATVNHPLALLPFCLSLCNEFLTHPGGLLFSAVSEGGASSLMGSMCGALAGSLFGEAAIPGRLIQELVNRKKITGILDHIADGRASGDLLREFILSEAPLSLKEKQELAAKMKHHPPKTKKPGTRKNMEKDLSRHVIESWTKLDKAKWKKEKKKFNKDDDEK